MSSLPRPARLGRPSLSVVLGALWLSSACSSTDFDLIEAADASVSDASVSDAAVDSAPDVTDETDAAEASCDPASVAQVGRYLLRNVASELCLASGEPIPVGTQPGFAVDMVACQASELTVWNLVPSLNRGFEVRHVQLDHNLDVRFAETNDGTALVLFTPHEYSNQRFAFRPRASRGQEMAPWHSLSQCVADRVTNVEIWACNTVDVSQRWELLPADCL